jgi:hypothetical protein
MFTLGVSFDAVLIRIKASALRRLRFSVQRNDREDQPENLPSGTDQQRANDQESAVP